MQLSAVPNAKANPLSAREREIVASVEVPGMMRDLADLGGPRVTGTIQARRAAELIRDKVAAIGGWDVQVEQLSGHGMGGQVPVFNVVADRKGTAPDGQRQRVVVGSHLDTAPGAPGANDDGSGAVALLALARSLATSPTRQDVRLAWFDGEEVGLVGARAHVAARKQEPMKTMAMIEAEMLGSPNGAPVLLFAGKTDAHAGDQLVDAAGRLGVGLEVSPDRPYGSDHNVFADVGVPAMVLSTTAPPGHRILRQDPNYHSPNDTIANLNTKRLGEMADLLAVAVNGYANS